MAVTKGLVNIGDARITESLSVGTGNAVGQYSVAEGSGTIASGHFSHAEGIGTKALHLASHTEGSGTTASGISSHAEGYISTASGNYSHAEGDHTVSYGVGSHSEGQSTVASGGTSHVEGCYSKTGGSETANTLNSGTSVDNGVYAHAEGNATQAKGVSSHSEGVKTFASGTASHAEGNNTRTSGMYSHAEGDYTQAIGSSSHAEGSNSKASGNYSHAEGYNSRTFGANSHAEGYNSKTGGSETANTLESGISVDSGAYAHAEGNATQAKGVSSHSEGVKTFASGTASHAEGYSTTASGSQAHAEGDGTTASASQTHAEGYNTESSSDYAHAEGCNTKANGVSSHAEGYNSKTGGYEAANTLERSRYVFNGYYAHAEGNATQAQGFSSHSEGIKTFSSGIASHTEGYYTEASGFYAHAEGFQTEASGYYSHAEGQGGRIINGTFSWTTGTNYAILNNEGTDNSDIPDTNMYVGMKVTTNSNVHRVMTVTNIITNEDDNDNYVKIIFDANFTNSTNNGNFKHHVGAFGYASHVEGCCTEASGDYSHAEGGGTEASGYYSHAEGCNTKANYDASHAEGCCTEASGDYSHAEGYNCKTGGSDYETTNTLTSGTSVNNGAYAHAEGNATQAKGVSSHSEGIKTFASGNGSHAEGYSINKTKDALDISASGNGSHAEGYAEVDDLSSKYKKRYDDLKNNPIYSILSNNNGSHAGGYVYHITDESGGGKPGDAIFNGYVSSWNTFSLANYYPYNAAFGEASFVHGNDVKGFNFSDSIFGWGNRSINYSQPEVFDTVFNIKTGDTTTLVGTCQYMNDIDDKNRLPIGPITVCGMFNSTCVDGNPLDYKYYYFGSYKGTRGQINLREYQPAFMVGNGSSPDPLERCNAFVVDYHGNIWVGNDIKTLGSIHCDGNVYGQEFVPSDERLKNIHSEIELNDCYKLINNSRYVKFDYKKDTDKKEHIGLIAQDVQKVFPQLVEEYDEGNLGLNYDSLVAVCMKTIKDLNERVTKLEEEINELKKNKVK